MDGLVFLIVMKELWEKVDMVTVASIMGLLGALSGTLFGVFVQYKTDRRRLIVLENDRDKMRKDFEQHKKENIETFEDIRNSIHVSNQSVLDKMDELKMYLLQSKITLKGENEKN